jgi:S-adenosylmethionine:tRNA ribosyltransferase-isomerase
MLDRLGDYHYELPPELVANRPPERRDDSRMLVLHRKSGEIEHRMFRDFPSLLQKGDRVVLNDSRVIKARLLSESPAIEIFLLESLGDTKWKCLTRPGRKLKPGVRIPIAGTVAQVLDVLPEGERIIQFESPPDLEKHGHMPLPPYFKRGADAADDERYQTVYAQAPGSIAAPTAGLHFTPELLAQFPHAFVTLHVGLGTFRPIKTEDFRDHPMHTEHYEIPAGFAEKATAADRLIAVGTTSARVLESAPTLNPHQGTTSAFIYPPYEFKRVGGLLTNFHLAHSTLLLLVAAFAGPELALRAYRHALEKNYRFFSFGDAMLVL